MVDRPLQPLSQNFKIVDENGFPNLYFIEWAQQRQIDIGAGITAEQAQQLIDDFAAARDIIAGVALHGGGNLSSDITIDHDDSLVTPGTYGDATHVAQFVVDQQGHIQGVVEVAISGGGGGGGLWYFSPPVFADFPTLVNGMGGTNLIGTDDADVGMVLEWQGNQGGTDNSQGCFKAPPAGVDWEVTTHFVMGVFSSNYLYGGLSIRCSATDRTFTYSQSLFNAYLNYFVLGQQADANQSVNSGLISAAPAINHMKLTYVNATGTFSLLMSTDGKTFRVMRSDNIGGYLGGAPDGVGFKIHCSTGDTDHDHNPVLTVDRWEQSW